MTEFGTRRRPSEEALFGPRQRNVLSTEEPPAFAALIPSPFDDVRRDPSTTAEDVERASQLRAPRDKSRPSLLVLALTTCLALGLAATIVGGQAVTRDRVSCSTFGLSSHVWLVIAGSTYLVLGTLWLLMYMNKDLPIEALAVPLLLFHAVWWILGWVTFALDVGTCRAENQVLFGTSIGVLTVTLLFVLLVLTYRPWSR